ncbi:hypothetical protein C1752_10955 [Acaryochloris thomasi RCC1774]|uniref:Uncharacterized protein n=1 Tax=Acaryochloris thomasi RCC1774 TaxID=1764569 RepID=A0A2W1J8R5_9CYAN|nr:hypothetical protein [Acaryochloris thomasi]PZD70526.1 hypothetical protein C1752_10955 [Acaryochloris thomasi RCC1774]
MRLSQALHTAARHYCQRQSSYWDQYSNKLSQTKPRPSNYQQVLLDGYARSNVLRVICIAIEQLNPDELNDLEQTRDCISQIGRVAQEPRLRPNMGQTTEPEVSLLDFGVCSDDAISHEREAFCNYVEELSESHLKSIEPLPYQRVLSPAESSNIWHQLRDRWRVVGPYWYPLSNRRLPGIAAFDADAFEEFCTSFSLIDLLASREITRILELREYGIEYEQDVSLFDPVYSNYEGYWVSDGFDWIIYASHECSVTLGGWLLKEVKAQWQDWEQHAW